MNDCDVFKCMKCAEAGVPCHCFGQRSDGVAWRNGAVKEQLAAMTNEQRQALFADLFTDHYCRHCGRDNPRCQCWNDE